MLPPSTNAALSALEDLRATVRPGARIAVAVSGGFDSTLLLAAMVRAGLPVTAVLHVDHRLREGPSSEDARFVRQLAASLGIPCFCAEVHGLSGLSTGIEAAARSARYAAFHRLALTAGTEEIWLAHHRDDQRETVAFRVLRRAGPRGLAGIAARRPLPALSTAAQIEVLPAPSMAPKQGAAPAHAACVGQQVIVRPWLQRTRAELRALAETLGHTAWREDATNQEVRFARNRLRLEVLPRAARLDPQFPARIDALQQMAFDLHRAQSDIVRSLTPRWIEPLGLGLVRLRLPPAPLAPELQHALHEALLQTLGVYPITRPVSEALALSAFGAIGQTWHIGTGLRITRHAFGIDVSSPVPDLPNQDRVAFLPLYAREGRFHALAFAPLYGRICVTRCDSPATRRLAVRSARRSHLRAALDLQAIVGTLTVRTPTPGERWKPWRSPGSQKLVKSMNARGMPLELRARLPVVADDCGALWVPGVGTAERASVQECTEVCLALRFRGRGAAALAQLARCPALR